MGVAQLVEQRVDNAQVTGSSPVIPTKFWGCEAHLGEQRPFTRRLEGSSPTTLHHYAVAVMIPAHAQTCTGHH